MGFIQFPDDSVCAASVGGEIDLPGGGLFLEKAGTRNEKYAKAEDDDGTKEGYPLHRNSFLAQGFEDDITKVGQDLQEKRRGHW